MKSQQRYAKPLMWFSALLMTALAAGCGGGGKAPILGTDVAVAIFVPPAGAVNPGACTAVGPTVTMSNPTNGNQLVATSTSGVAGGGKSITATFSEAMNGTTINPTTFTLAPVGGAALIPASVNYNANVATLNTSAALLANTSYTAVIQGAVTSAAGTPIGCNYVWTFKTATVAVAGALSVNLGRAAPYAIASTAGVTNASATTINGNVALDPKATCNDVSVLAAGTFGLCNGFAPTLNGVVASPLFPDAGVTSGAVKADLRAAYIALSPAILAGAIAIPAGTTLGNSTGSVPVQGDNYFVPGVYQSLTSISITGDVTLDAQGDANAVFVFQSSSTIGTPGSGADRILLVNGAKASNVYWWAGSAATLGTNTVWQGNILASDDVTMRVGATSCGRLFAGASTDGAFVLDGNVVSVPGNPSAPATCQ